METEMGTIIVLGVLLSGMTFIMLLVLSMLIDRNARKTVKDLKKQIAEVNSNLMVAINALVVIGKAVSPVKKEEAVQQVQEAPAKPAKKAVYPKGSPEAKERMAKLREAADAKRKEEAEAKSKQEAADAKLKEVAELEARLAALKGDQQ